MKDRKDALERLFDIELDFTFQLLEQAWAALVLALDIQDIPKFLRNGRPQEAKTVENVEILKLRVKRKSRQGKFTSKEKRLLLLWK